MYDFDRRYQFEVAAKKLAVAYHQRKPISSVAKDIESDEMAYQAQFCRNCLQLLYDREGEKSGKAWVSAGRISGFKVGATSQAAQNLLGTKEPVFGLEFAENAAGDDETLSYPRVSQPIVEAEIAFVLGRDLPDKPVYTVLDIIPCVEYVIPALEIPDPRFQGGLPKLYRDLIADNSAAGAYVLGGPPLHRLADLSLTNVEVGIFDGQQGGAVGIGSGSDCMGNPLNALVWLAHKLSWFRRSLLNGLDDRLLKYAGKDASGKDVSGNDNPQMESTAEVLRECMQLRAGHVILSGALNKPFFAKPNTRYTANFSGLGSVSVGFGELGKRDWA